MSIAVGLDIAVRALLSQQLGADTVSHNIANVNSDGYSRQRLSLEALPGPATPYGPGPGPGRGSDRVPMIGSPMARLRQRAP